jgi:hypothetical protein
MEEFLSQIDFWRLWSAATWRRFVIDHARSRPKRRQAAALQRGCYEPSAAMMLAADLNASAMSVNVGLAVQTVGKLPLPTTHMFGTSCER